MNAIALGLPAAVAALAAWQLGALLTADGRGQRDPSPLPGALAFALAVTIGFAAAPLPPAEAGQARILMLGGALVLIAGLWGDVGRGPKQLGLVAIVLAAILACQLGGAEISAVKMPFVTGPDALLSLAPISALATVLFLVVVAIVVRATDPVPGLTAGLGVLTAGTFLVVALTHGRSDLAGVGTLTAPLACAVAAACLGLVTPGLGPRALSLGRGGAGLLGYLLGVLAIIGTLKHTAFLLLGLPLLALAVPLLNVWYMQRQWLKAGHADPATLDRARTLPEMLARRGFTHRRTAGLLLALQGYCCLIALLLVLMIELPLVLKVVLLLTVLPVAFAAFFLISRIAARVGPVAPGKITILGLPIDAVTYEGAVAAADRFVQERAPRHVFTADVSGLMRAREDEELAEIIRTSDLVTADGAGVLWAARVFDFPLPERVSGVDLVRRFSGLAAAKGYRVFLLGAAEGVAQAAADQLCREHPGLTICGVQHGFFESEAAVAQQLREARPDFLFVALGIPRQERFIRTVAREVGVPVSMGVGGSFDVISGRLERAPLWMQRAGLEWLFRVIQEPKRLPRLLALPRFGLAIATDAWRAYRRRGPSS